MQPALKASRRYFGASDSRYSRRLIWGRRGNPESFPSPPLIMPSAILFPFLRHAEPLHAAVRGELLTLFPMVLAEPDDRHSALAARLVVAVWVKRQPNRLNGCLPARLPRLLVDHNHAAHHCSPLRLPCSSIGGKILMLRPSVFVGIITGAVIPLIVTTHGRSRYCPAFGPASGACHLILPPTRS